MEQELQKLETEAKEVLATLSTTEQLEEFRIRYLGRKGQFSVIMKSLGKVDKEDRPRL